MTKLRVDLRNRSGWRIGSCAAVSLTLFLSFSLWPILTGTSGAQTIPQTTWIHHAGLQEFSKGSLADSGRNLYISATGKVQTINRWDLNRDGFLDLVFTQDTNYRTESADAIIYWGSTAGFVSLFPSMWEQRPRSTLLERVVNETGRFSRLPTFGGGRSRIVDLNSDGFLDIVFVNQIHNYTHQLSAYIYWGSRLPYSVQRRTELPTLFAHGLDVGDLNGDGYLDLVFANRGDYEWESRFGPRDNCESYIYWGGPAGFSTEHRSSLPTHNALDCAVGDYNGDGALDVAFINLPVKEPASLFVYYNSGKGFSSDTRSVLSVNRPTALRAMDLDGDKFSELCLMLFGGHSLVLKGRPEGLDINHAVQLPVVDAEDAASADLNRDGSKDLVFASASGSHSVIYWGTEHGVVAQNPTLLPTLTAKGLTIADLNQDGYPDVAFANHQDQAGHDVPSYIYWGSRKGFAAYLRDEVQGFGPVSIGSGDLNQDGRPDLLLINQLSGANPNPVNALIFWGNPHAFYSANLMTELRNVGDGQVTSADLNDDGYPDLVLMSTICWGSPEGYQDSHRTVLPSDGVLLGSRVADLNRDGFLDLLFAERNNNSSSHGRIFWGGREGFSKDRSRTFALPCETSYPNLADLNRDGLLDLIAGDIQGKSCVLWGTAQGFDQKSPLFLETHSSDAVQIADLDGNGWLDLIFCGSADLVKKSRRSETTIYYGSGNGLFKAPPDRLEGYSTLEAAVGDLNRDGFLDVVTGNYSAGLTRSLPTFVYWGGRDGRFHDQRRTQLPAESSAGIQLLDLDGNGYLDLVVHNHIKEGRHDFGAYIYWGSSEGFDLKRRTHMPTTATHMSNMTDVGNVYTRKLEEEYLSAPIMKPARARFSRLHWKGETPLGTSVRLQIRAAQSSEELKDQAWSGPSFASFFASSGESLPPQVKEKTWLQYRVFLGSPDGGNCPSLTEVSLECEAAP